MKRFKEHQLEYMEKRQAELDAKKREEDSENRYYHNPCYTINPWTYIPKAIKKNIGKDVDETSSKILSKFKKMRLNLHWFDVFEKVSSLFTNHRNADHHTKLFNFSTEYGYRRAFRHFAEFTVDSQNRIQLNKNYPKPQKHVYTIMDHSRQVQFFEDVSPMYTGRPIWVLVDPNKDRYLYKQLYDEWIKWPERSSIWLHYTTHRRHSLFKVDRPSIDVVVTKYQFMRDRYERFQKKHLRKIAEKKRSKAIVYDMLSRAERELKKEKEGDYNKLIKHGFDDESFKGSFYHGQKRKLKGA